MTLPSSGPLSISNLVAEYGGTAPHAMSEYYNKPGGVTSGNPLPMSSFYGLSANPILEGSATTNFTGGTATFTYPSGVQSGDLIIALLGVDDNFRIQSGGPSGFTSLTSVLGAGAGEGKAWYRFASGGESGNFSFALPGGGVQGGGTATVRISNTTTAPQVATAGGANPPSLTPSWGSADTLWLAGLIQRFGSITGYPSGYSGAGTDSAALAWRVNRAASEDPGAFSTSGSDGNACMTIAVYPS